ncbi:MAG TPA: lytic transglycosylase domain-containing protein [Terracidiphilus sp.]|nr:lytic transglycosylase domain-containing protein [Terracidiphilus sp.]
MIRPLRIAALAAAGLLAAAPACLHAAEIVTLSNGFTMRCNHHTQVDGRVRIFLGSGEDSYIELRPEEVASVATVPDTPSAPSPEPAPQSKADARLTPADLHQMLAHAGQAHNVNVDLLASVVKAESGGNPRAVSRAGAKGLMQLMPQTASEHGVSDSFQPGQNIRGGTAYLDELLTRYNNNLALALAAYNAGPAAVDKYHGIPPYRETRAYVARVIHEFNRRIRQHETEEASASQSTTGR